MFSELEALMQFIMDTWVFKLFVVGYFAVTVLIIVMFILIARQVFKRIK